MHTCCELHLSHWQKQSHIQWLISFHNFEDTLEFSFSFISSWFISFESNSTLHPNRTQTLRENKKKTSINPQRKAEAYKCYEFPIHWASAHWTFPWYSVLAFEFHFKCEFLFAIWIGWSRLHDPNAVRTQSSSFFTNGKTTQTLKSPWWLFNEKIVN